MPRIFKYNDQEWGDPGQEYTVEDVRKQLASFLPEIARAGVEKKKLPDGTEQITFVKRSGTKGIDANQFPLGTDCPFCGEPISVDDLPERDDIITCPHCAERVRVICHVTTWFALDECDISECVKAATPTVAAT